MIVLDEEVLRDRKIANAGDLLRFEMEGLGASLPAHKRVLGYDVWFEPLPRTTTGKMKRFEIERRLTARAAEKHAEAAAPLTAAEQDWLDDTHAGHALALVRQRAKAGAAVRPDANLELDLGLDSMERVELLTELEQRFALKVPEATAHEIVTVRQLVEAVRPSGDAAGGCGRGRRLEHAAARSAARQRPGAEPPAGASTADGAAAVADRRGSSGGS